MLTSEYIKRCVSIVQAMATEGETEIAVASLEGEMAARMAAKVVWMMDHRGLMLLTIGELRGNLCPPTRPAPLEVVEALEVAEALKIGETSQGMKARMQVHHTGHHSKAMSYRSLAQLEFGNGEIGAVLYM